MAIKFLKLNSNFVGKALAGKSDKEMSERMSKQLGAMRCRKNKLAL